jgi:hypothetical protein
LRKAKKLIQANGFKIYNSVEEGKEMVNEDLTSALTALLAILIGIPALPIAGALLMGLIDYLFNDLPDQRAEAKSLRSYKGPDKQEKVLALAKEIEAKLSPGKKRYLKTLVNRIGASKLEDKAREYRELDRYASSEKSRMDRGLNENLKTDIESALEDLPIPTNMEEGEEMVNEGVGTIALGIAGGLLLIKLLKVVAKKVVGTIGMNVPLPKEKLHQTTDEVFKQAIFTGGKLNMLNYIALKSVIKEMIDKGEITKLSQIVKAFEKASKEGVKQELVNEAKGKLVDEKTGEEVTLPYKTLDFRGNPITVVSFRAPHKSSSTGRIYTKDNGEYFPGVAGLKIIDHSFSENLNESMFPMLKKILK